MRRYRININQISYASVAKLSAALDAGSITALELTKVLFERAKSLNDTCKAYIEMFETSALNKAKKLGNDSFRLYFLLGKVYLFLSCSEKSLSHFKKALEKKPSHEETKYIINALDGERHVSARSLKASVVKSLFDDYAEKFENHLINRLNYETPKKLVKFFLAKTEKKMELKIWEKEPPFVLDLGCGTGLFARELKQKLNKSQIVGVDLSSQMLKQAIKKDVYFELYQEDLLKFLAQEKKKNSVIC